MANVAIRINFFIGLFLIVSPTVMAVETEKWLCDGNLVLESKIQFGGPIGTVRYGDVVIETEYEESQSLKGIERFWDWGCCYSDSDGLEWYRYRIVMKKSKTATYHDFENEESESFYNCKKQ